MPARERVVDRALKCRSWGPYTVGSKAPVPEARLGLTPLEAGCLGTGTYRLTSNL